MPTPGQQRYTVVGFSDELDWRELNFVEAIGSNRICQACGLVTRITALLSCRHIFCKMCYEQCRHEDGYRCPLEGQEVLEDDVQWMEFSVQKLLSRKVKCWNEHQGCDKIFAASELSKHFAKDCEHHATSCPRCSTFVLCSNACKHIQSECRGNVASSSLKDPLSNSSDQKAVMSTWNAIIDMRVGEVKEMLDHVVNDNNAQGERLNEMSHCMNTVKQTQLAILSKIDTLKQASSTDAIRETMTHNGETLHELAAAMTVLKETFKKALDDTELRVEEVKENTMTILQEHLRELFLVECSALSKTFRRELQATAATISLNCAKIVATIVEAKECEKRTGSTSINREKIWALSGMNVTKDEFTVNDVEAKKERALSDGSCVYEDKMKYICGYCLSTGVEFRKEEESVFLCAYMKLHKGIIDDVLEWPLCGYLGISVKHPSGKKLRIDMVEIPGLLRVIGNRSSNKSDSWTSTVGICSDRIYLDDLESEGYVVDDNIHVVWELV